MFRMSGVTPKASEPVHAPRAAEAGDDLVEDQQDVVGGADLAQSLQVADRRNHHAGRAGERLDDHGRDVGGIVQRDQVQQLVGQLGALCRHAAREGVLLELRVGQVVGLHRLAEVLAVAHHAADRDAAEVHAVVTLLATDQACLARLSLGAPVGARHLQRGVGRFRAGAGEEHAVQPLGHEADDAVGQLERQRVAELERGRIVELCRLAAHRLGNLGAAVAQAAAPQARETVEDLAPVGVTVVAALGTGHEPGVRLEVAVAGEGHPVRGQPVGVRARGGGVQALCIGHVHGGPRHRWLRQQAMPGQRGRV
jgi:hypothetical protein